MSGTPDRTNHDSLDDDGWASRLDGRARESYELANAVEWEDTDVGSICYIYPADASDSDLKTQWLAVPVGLLVELDESR